MSFYQSPPSLGNQYNTDRVLRNYLQRTLPSEVLTAIAPELEHMGDLSGNELYNLQLTDRLNEPKLISWNPWGHRIDRIELTPLWIRCAQIAAEQGLIATAYEAKHGALSRIHQFALVHLFAASSDVYTCPLAMTDGAARTLIHHGNSALIDRAIPHLTSRNKTHAWTSGQWMTERTGGSDVGRSETIAQPTDNHQWKLYGTKWFTSATTSEMALTLARPEGNPPGGRGLALFYLETMQNTGAGGVTKTLAEGLYVNRLKDKLGTRKVPTAELTLDGVRAFPVIGLDNGVRNIAPMLTITRIWNAVCAVSGMRRAIALARDYAQKREAFGKKLSDQPLHNDTLATLAAEYEAAFHIVFRAVELLGKSEQKTISPTEEELFRLLVPIVKLLTGKQAVSVASETLESFGGAGYVEDTGLPTLLRDAQVLPIWEGTTNVLSLDVLRVLGKNGEAALQTLLSDAERHTATVKDPTLVSLGKQAVTAIQHAIQFCLQSLSQGIAVVESNARRIAMTLGRGYAAALLVNHAQWSLDHQNDPRAKYAASRFIQQGIDLLYSHTDHETIRALALDSDG